MAVNVAALFASHTPLKHYRSPGAAIQAEVDDCFDALREWVSAFAPNLVVAIGPDHFNGFFYRLMPSFCVGAAASSIGDWKTPAGDLPCDADLAESCVRYLHGRGIDAALSHRMELDHGIIQLLVDLFTWDRVPTVVPVFVNCAAPPLPPIARVVALGTALGEFVSGVEGRILVTASGGLSHDPPIPALAGAPASVRERLVAGGELSSEARVARQERLLADAADQVVGRSAQRPLNPEWDRRFLEQLQRGDFNAIAALDDAAITRDAGCGGHEIRSWIAASAAARAAGVASFELKLYRPIPEWVAGFGVMTGGPAPVTDNF